MTQQAQIVPNYVNPPRDPSWANGSVKDQGGQLWSVHKDALHMFAKGQPVNVGFEPPYGTKKYPQIVSVNGQPIGQPQGAGFTPAGQAAQAVMPQQQAWQPQTQAAAPAQAPHSPAPQASPGGTSKECGMFVMGVIGRMLHGTGTFPDNKSLRDMVYNARLAWEIEMEGRQEPAQPGAQPSPAPGQQGNTGGPPPGHPAAEEPPFDDEIRF